MTKQPSLQQLFDIARHQAARIFHESGEMLPMWHAVAGDNGEHLLVATPWCGDDEKDDVVAALRALFAERKVTMFVFMCEAWAIKLDAPIKDGARIRIPRPSEHEDRREVLRVNAEDRAGNVLSGQFYILRPEHGPATLSPFAQDPTNGTVTGRMSGLLATSKK